MGKNMKELKSRVGDHVPRGFVPMLVGFNTENQRFLLHRELLKHPSIVSLLDIAAGEFGYSQHGILKIPCDVQYFKEVVHAISKRKQEAFE